MATDGDWDDHTTRRDELFSELLSVEAECAGIEALRLRKLQEIENHKEVWIAQHGQSDSLARPLWSVIGDTELGL